MKDRVNRRLIILVVLSAGIVIFSLGGLVERTRERERVAKTPQHITSTIPIEFNGIHYVEALTRDGGEATCVVRVRVRPDCVVHREWEETR